MKEIDILPQPNAIDNAVLFSWAQALETMSGLMKEGTALVPALEDALKKIAEPRVHKVLEEMLLSWNQQQTILPPLEKRVDVVPWAVYWLSAAGFTAGLLELMWARAASMLRLRLKKIEFQRSDIRFRTDDEPAWDDPLFISYQMRLLFEFGTLVGSGIRSSAALWAVAEDSGDTLWKKSIIGGADALEAGRAFSDVFSKDPYRYLRPEWLPGIMESEKEDQLDTCLLTLADDLKSKLVFR